MKKLAVVLLTVLLTCCNSQAFNEEAIDPTIKANKEVFLI